MANRRQPLQVIHDGETAIAYLGGEGEYGDRDRHPLPVLILLDLKLPRRSGIEILEWIRQRPIVRRIPVIVLTSSRESLDLNRSYDLGVSSYLVKPVNFDALATLLAAVNTYWLQLNEYPSLMLAE